MGHPNDARWADGATWRSPIVLANPGGERTTPCENTNRPWDAGSTRSVGHADTLSPMESAPLTPNNLARELGVSPRSIRAYLRSTYGRLAVRNETCWQLNREQASDVRREFQRRAGR